MENDFNTGNEETLDTHNEEFVEETVTDLDEEIQEDSDEDLREKISKLESEIAKRKQAEHNQKIRAEKAEKALKLGNVKEDKPTAHSNELNLSALDTIALMKANIEDEEDINEVIEYARFKKIPISQALKSTVIRASLEEKAEHRKSALAMSTKSNRSSVQKPTEEILMSKAQKGEMPDSEDDIAKLYRARKGLK